MIEKLSYVLFKAALARSQGRNFSALIEATNDPALVQWEFLQSILQANADTEFGEEHAFNNIDSVESYRANVPVCEFEFLRPYIEKQRDTGVRALTSAEPIYYNRTSGTTGSPKDVPVTQQAFDETRRDSQISAYLLSRDTDALVGKVFAIGGSAEEDRTVRGVPIGSASGMLYRQQSRFVRSRYVLPPEAFDVEDMETRYIVCAVYGLAQSGVSAVATANPSTFIRLNDVIQNNPDVVLRHLAEGTMPECNVELTPLSPQPKRARDLSSMLDRHGSLNYRFVWPRLRAVIAWCGGSCGFALSRLRLLIPESCQVIELGYNASEFRGTINVSPRVNRCLPTFQHTFFEFVRQDDWENGDMRFLSLHELEQDQLYYIFATTTSGLFRYDINDIVRVTGWINRTPTLEFVQKGRGVTNITGEKLSEYQVLEGVKAVRSEVGVDPTFFVVLADEANAQYLLCMELDVRPDSERIATVFDTSLQGLNVEYESKRKSERLGKVRFVLLPPGTGFDYRSDLIAAGQRDSQFKYMHLQYLKETALTLPNDVHI